MKPTIPEVLPRFRAYYATPEGSGGGPMHIILEDGNTADHWVDACIETAMEWGDVEGEALCRILREMSRTQRIKLGRLL